MLLTESDNDVGDDFLLKRASNLRESHCYRMCKRFFIGGGGLNGDGRKRKGKKSKEKKRK